MTNFLDTAITVGTLLYVLAITLVLKYTITLVNFFLRKLVARKNKKTEVTFECNEKPEKSVKQWTTSYNGWVYMKKEALQEAPELVQTPLSLMLVKMPPEVKIRLYPLSLYDLAQEVRSNDHFNDTSPPSTDDEDLDEVKRGMTIGSALFNYCIPTSFVLNDDRTKLLCALYRHHIKERKTYEVWLRDYPKLFSHQYDLVSAVELEFQLTKDDLVNFYNKHAEKVIHLVMRNACKEMVAYMDAFILHALRILKVSLDERNKHMMRTTVTLIIRNTGIEVLSDWFMLSKLVDQTFNAINNIETPARMSLVVNNSLDTGKDNHVW